ncbi:tryptophan/tyrosine permease [Vitreoscilla sp. C1]|nr:tryptophan/tyrosine permease [Vitreoscilla sp. C1]
MGGMMIVAGTAIGAGMFANPTATAGIWYTGAMLVMLYTWYCMCVSGLMIMEVNQHYPAGASFNTLVKDLLGPAWNLFNGFAFVFVVYILLYAYIFVGGSVLQTWLAQAGITDSSVMASTLFMLVFALCVWWSTKAVDRLSTVLIVGMALTFLSTVTGLLSHVMT